MRLARRAFFAAPTLVTLPAARTLRPGNSSQNQFPTVGTGGPPGGPTGLLTIYDGDTLREGEFTFDVAYGNYDRDPGNVNFLNLQFYRSCLSKCLEHFSCSKVFAALQCRRPAGGGRGIVSRASVISPSALSPCLNLLLSG